ncbi:hypothetical protein N7489_004821 [Penicillium chrysogenum]|nr:uncharacterized protein N7489_004821 [Penicillium chrysogenum]KAJ5244725.1 hypothetical protein N7489_004821 [Penicillium chrysogenum]
MANIRVSSDKLASEANPIFIDADADDDCGEQHTTEQDDSDCDTEPLSTPVFWKLWVTEVPTFQGKVPNPHWRIRIVT